MTRRDEGGGGPRVLRFAVDADGAGVAPAVEVRLPGGEWAERTAMLFPGYRREGVSARPPCHRLEVVEEEGRFAVRSVGSDAEEARRSTGSLELVDALSWLEAALAHALLRSTRDRIHLHGAAVAVGEAALLVLGPAGAGKSSLSLAWSLQGRPVLGDDVLMVDPSGSLVPFRRLLKLDVERLRVHGVPPESTPGWAPGSPEAWFDPRVAGGWARKPVRCRAVVLLDRCRGREGGEGARPDGGAAREPGSSLTEMSPSESLAALLASVVPTGVGAEAGLDSLVSLLDACRGFRLSFASTRRAAASLVDLVRRP